MATCSTKMARLYDRLASSTELRWRLLLTVALVLGTLMISANSTDTDTANTWYSIYIYSAALIVTAQMSDSAVEFFSGAGASTWDHIRYYLTGYEKASTAEATLKTDAELRADVGFWSLMPSAFITWIFAKSIFNSATLGGYFGVLGGVGYAGWYASFGAAALVGYQLRVRHGFLSMPAAVTRCYGPYATLFFSASLLFRLWNEVWSNAVVVAGFYGEVHSNAWWIAVAFSVIVPATYVMMGGMRASLLSDQVQALLGVVFLFVILGLIGDQMPGGLNALWSYEPPEGWLPGGGYLLIAALLQGCGSYPFMDPVLTDRAFLSRPRTMVYSLVIGGCIAGTFIILFSAAGIYGCVLAGAVKNGNPTVMARALSSTAFTFVNLVMMTSSMSTLDSTFTSIAKLGALEVVGWFKLPGDKRGPKQRGPLTPSDPSVTQLHVAIGRASIVLLAILGPINLLANTEALSATTISGTVVIGLGPPIYLMLFWRFNSAPGAADGWPCAPLAFLFSFIPGAIIGSLYSVATTKIGGTGALRYPDVAASLDRLAMGDGPYATFLGVNVVGIAACIVGCAMGFAIHYFVWKLPPPDAEETREDPRTGKRIPRKGYVTQDIASA